MGLDMYFTMRKPEVKGDVLMCCNGGFPIGFQCEGKQIGYLRKAYTINDFLIELLEVNFEDINCVDLELTKEHIEHIIKEIEFRFEENYFEDDWDEDDWKQFNEIIRNIITLSKDPDIKFYYTVWY